MHTPGSAAFKKVLEGQSQKALAEALDVTQGTVSKLASGDYDPSFALRVKLEKQTGIPAEDWGGEIGAYLKQKRRKAG